MIDVLSSHIEFPRVSQSLL